MSARATMRHRCIVERDTTATDDSWGQTDEPTWETHLPDLPCRAWFDTDNEVIDGSKTAVLEHRKVIVPLDTDITESDRILEVRDRRGNLLFDGPAQVEAVGRRQDHIELIVEGVS